jgi:hypothetical protein
VQVFVKVYNVVAHLVRYVKMGFVFLLVLLTEEVVQQEVNVVMTCVLRENVVQETFIIIGEIDVRTIVIHILLVPRVLLHIREELAMTGGFVIKMKL